MLYFALPIFDYSTDKVFTPGNPLFIKEAGIFPGWKDNRSPAESTVLSPEMAAVRGARIVC